MNEGHCDELVQSVWQFLNQFYRTVPVLNPLDFLTYTESGGARVLIDETSGSDCAYVSIELPCELSLASLKNQPVNPQTLSVISEEISHFLHYSCAAESETPISVFELETRGEIDRFLCFLYWNDFCPRQPMERIFENCREVCEVLFQERYFCAKNESLYRDAESHALFHIRQAFAHCWSRRWVDTSRLDERARTYLLERTLGPNFKSLSA